MTSSESKNPSRPKARPFRRGPLTIDFSAAAVRQNRDLLAATKAGFSVGVVDFSDSQPGAISSLSVPVKRLGIAEDILEAWDLAPSDYIVLLIRASEGYPSPKDYLTGGRQDRLVQFQLGRCTAPKPSAQAFMTRSSKEEEEGDDECRKFVPLYPFNFMTKLLEKDLAKLLEIRVKTGTSWEAAQEMLYNLASPVQNSQQPQPNQKSIGAKIKAPQKYLVFSVETMYWIATRMQAFHWSPCSAASDSSFGVETIVLIVTSRWKMASKQFGHTCALEIYALSTISR